MLDKQPKAAEPGNRTPGAARPRPDSGAGPGAQTGREPPAAGNGLRAEGKEVKEKQMTTNSTHRFPRLMPGMATVLTSRGSPRGCSEAVLVGAARKRGPA